MTLGSILGELISGGVIVTESDAAAQFVDWRTGDHPLPSRRNVEATEEMLELLDSVGSETL